MRGSKKEIVRLFRTNQVEQAYLRAKALLTEFPADYELHYILGMIHGSQYRYVDALQSFSRALTFNPGHRPSLTERGIIFMTLRRDRQALAEFREALRVDPLAHDVCHYVREIERRMKPVEPTLAACLIVKNEAKHLPNCLKSIQAVVDEMVVVDTGSEDATPEIARQFGARVVQFEWRKDFAAARNFAIRQAESDWILQIDADEELFPEDQYKIREIIHQRDCNGAFVAMRNRNSSLFGENPCTVHYLVRLYRNHRSIYYVNPIHETLKISGEVVATDINFLHHGYNLDAEYMKQKRRRNAEILYQRLQSDPSNITTLFYLSMMHLGNEEYDQAGIYAKQVLEKLSPQDAKKQHFYLMMLNNLAWIHVEKQNYALVQKYCEQAIAINSNYLDPQFFLGLSYFKEEQYEKARETFERFLKKYGEITQNPVFNLFAHSSHAYLYQVYHLLGKISRREKNYPVAQRMMLKAIESNPNFWIGYADLGYLSMDLSEWQKAAHYLSTAVSIAKKSPHVNRNNRVVWFDFFNLLKNYVAVLKKCAGAAKAAPVSVSSTVRQESNAEQS
ncbi:MAG: glycosyltransferase [bacterium]